MSYKDQERLVLSTLKEQKKIEFRRLCELVGMSDDDLKPMLVDFKKKEWVVLYLDGTAELLPAGVIALNKWDQLNSGGGDTFIIHNYGNNSQFGRGNTLHIQQTNNPDFNQAISSIVDLIKSSDLSQVAKEEALSNVESVANLGAHPSPTAWERVKVKVTAVESIVKGTEVAVKISQHLPAVYRFFENVSKQM